MTSDRTAGAPVVAGVDGSPFGLAAARLAATEAQLRARPLVLLYALDWPYLDAPIDPELRGPIERSMRAQADRFLGQAANQARQAAPGVEVRTEISVSSPASALLQAASHAALVVVGERGPGGFSGLMVGATAVQVATHAACPVLVARGHPVREASVVLGADGSPNSNSAVAFAFEEASLRRACLTVLHAWRHPTSLGWGDMLPLVYDVDQTEADEARLLSEAISGWPDKYPDVVVRREMQRESPARALIRASTDAQLLVVGSRGHGGFTGLLLGSVGQAVLHHASCPVAIIRPGSHSG